MGRRSAKLKKIAQKKELDDLRVAYNRECALTERLSNKLEVVFAQNEKIVDIVERVCRYSVALPAKTDIIRRPELLSTYRKEVRDYQPYSADGIIDFSSKIVNLHLLRCMVFENQEKMSMAMHCRYYADNRVSEYYLTREAFYSMPIEYIAEAIIPDMIQKLKMVA